MQVYSKEQTEMASLHHHSAGLGAMLRSGLGWLGSAPSAPHPRESPWVRHLHLHLHGWICRKAASYHKNLSQNGLPFFPHIFVYYTT